ncbi:MAG: glycosyltransferase family 4 protein [Humidesulfovibrio sp.]|uniref:glycosyltransferase family 4 protein n=1 Tax=Humidesulfovibrio sp. TaxID=2910988 RepID=UPI0027E7BC58|nr:glycosyltransferase family 4 protein [Humidesulfovibrio sp.]MDQ7834272.1 glycosyltransferase family 4 protein [Humidesulfovibrio sp.]
MNLCFVISSLVMGGAERVLALVANGLAEHGYNVTVLTFCGPDCAPHYQLHPTISLIPLGIEEKSGSLPASLWNNGRRIGTLRKVFDVMRPDAVISFMDSTNVLSILASRGLGIPVLVSEHIDPAQHDIGRIWNLLRHYTYPHASRVLLLTSGIDQYFPAPIRKRCTVMPNPVVVDCSGECPLPLEGRCIVGLGRLSPQKGFDILLQAFAQVAPKHPDSHLWILGEGPERAALEALRDTLGLRDRAHLPGSVPDPGPVLKRAHAFALSSRYEGFPLALCEALACGVATVSTVFSPGAMDILQDGENALVIPVEDTSALAEALDRLLADEKLRDGLSVHAPKILERFGLDKVIDLWEALLAQTVEERGRP